MALLLIPVFLLSLAYTILGVSRVNDILWQFLIVLLGVFVMGISLPLVIVVLNGFAGGFIENQLGFLWRAVKLITVADGDIYMGAGGFLLVVISTISVVMQMLIVRLKRSV